MAKPSMKVRLYIHYETIKIQFNTMVPAQDIILNHTASIWLNFPKMNSCTVGTFIYFVSVSSASLIPPVYLHTLVPESSMYVYSSRPFHIRIEGNGKCSLSSVNSNSARFWHRYVPLSMEASQYIRIYLDEVGVNATSLVIFKSTWLSLLARCIDL